MPNRKLRHLLLVRNVIESIESQHYLKEDITKYVNNERHELRRERSANNWGRGCEVVENKNVYSQF